MNGSARDVKCAEIRKTVRKHGHIQCHNVVVVDVVQLLFVLFIFNIFFLELVRIKTFFFLELFSIV